MVEVDRETISTSFSELKNRDFRLLEEAKTSVNFMRDERVCYCSETPLQGQGRQPSAMIFLLCTRAMNTIQSFGKCIINGTREDCLGLPQFDTITALWMVAF